MDAEHLHEELLQIRPVVLAVPVGHLQLTFLFVAHRVIPPHAHRGCVEVYMPHIHVRGESSCRLKCDLGEELLCPCLVDGVQRTTQRGDIERFRRDLPPQK